MMKTELSHEALRRNALIVGLIAGAALASPGLSPAAPLPRARPVPVRVAAAPAAKSKVKEPPKSRLTSLPRARPQSKVTMDFRDAPVDQILNFYSVITGLTVIKDPGLTGTATLISPRPMTVDDSIKVLDALLDSRGYRLDRSSTMMRVVNKGGGGGGRGNRGGGDTSNPGGNPSGGRGERSSDEKTQVFQLKYASAKSLASIVNDLYKNAAQAANRGRGGNNNNNNNQPQPQASFARASADDYSNSVIATGPPDQLTQIQDMINQIDKPVGSNQVTQVFPVKYLNVTDLASVVSNVLLATATNSATSGSAGSIPLERRAFMNARMGSSAATNGQVVAHAETNSLIVTASEESLDLVQNVIQELDKPQQPQSTTFVRNLKNASATEVAQLLNQMYGSRNNNNRNSFFGNNNNNNTSRNRLNNNNNNNRNNNRNNNNNNRNNGFGGNNRNNGFGGNNSGFSFRGNSLDSYGGSGIDIGIPSAMKLEPSDAVYRSTDGSLRVPTARTASWTGEGDDPIAQAMSQPFEGALSGPAPSNSHAPYRPSRLRNGTFMAPFSMAQYSANAAASASPDEEDPDAMNAPDEPMLSMTAPQLRQLLAQAQGNTSGAVRSSRGTGGTVTNVVDPTGNIQATPDVNTNSIIFNGDPATIEALDRILASLDRAPEQVLIEAVIVEANLDETNKLGFQFNWTQQNLKNGIAGSGAVDTAPTGISPTGLKYSIVGNNFSAILQALKTDSRFNILSTPRIFTANNRQAQINISQQIPYISNTFINAAGSTSNSISYLDVGIILDVTPHITGNGLVTIEVSQDANDFQGFTSFNAPIVSRRSTDTTVVAQDGQTIIIGGLIRDSVTKSRNKVPILGDLPILGTLFRSKSHQKQKTELMVFLTPHVVRTIDQTSVLTQNQQDLLRVAPRFKLGLPTPLEPANTGAGMITPNTPGGTSVPAAPGPPSVNPAPQPKTGDTGGSPVEVRSGDNAPGASPGPFGGPPADGGPGGPPPPDFSPPGGSE